MRFSSNERYDSTTIAATPPNVRRSQRERFSPLEWWRNEKFVYGRSPDPDEGPLLVPLIKAIERPPKPDPIPLGAARHRGKKRGVKVKKEDPDELVDGEGVFGGPRTAEDGLDDETEELGVVLDYATQREVERRESSFLFTGDISSWNAPSPPHLGHVQPHRTSCLLTPLIFWLCTIGIAFPGARVEFTPTEGPFHFQKIFGDSDFFAAGLMKIPVGGRKPNKSSKENTYVSRPVSVLRSQTSAMLQHSRRRIVYTTILSHLHLAPKPSVSDLSSPRLLP